MNPEPGRPESPGAAGPEVGPPGTVLPGMRAPTSPADVQPLGVATGADGRESSAGTGARPAPKTVTDSAAGGDGARISRSTGSPPTTSDAVQAADAVAGPPGAESQSAGTGPHPAAPKKSWRKRLKRVLRGTLVGRALHRIQYGLFLLGLGLLARVPPGLTDPAASALGFVFRWLHRRRLRTARRNLAIAFPQADPERLRGHFRHLAATAIETARLARELSLGGPAVLDRWIQTEGLEILERARAHGRGVILAAPHLGNWELLAIGLARRALAGHAVSRTLENPLIDRWVVRFRTQTGLRLIDKKGGVREAVRTLRDGGILLVLPDQYGGSTGVPVRYFGTETRVHGIVGALAGRLGSPVVFATCIRTGPAQYRLRFSDLPIPGDAQPEAVTQAVFDAIERSVREAPEQWLWVHELWRGRHEGPGAGARAGTTGKSFRRRFQRWIIHTRFARLYWAAEWLIFKAAWALLGTVPVRCVPLLARSLAVISCIALSRPRLRILQNFRHVMGSDLAPQRSARMLLRVFEHSWLAAVDSVLFHRRVRKSNAHLFFNAHGLAAVDAELRRGRGVIFALVHQGNWELAALHMALLGYPMVGIFAPRTNPWIEGELRRFRESTGQTVLYREGVVWSALNALHAKSALSVVVDVRAKTGGATVSLLGQPTRFHSMLLTLARRCNSRIIPFRSIRVGVLRYENTFGEPITAGREEAPGAGLARLTSWLEAGIRAHPEQWAWSSRIWSRYAGA